MSLISRISLIGRLVRGRQVRQRFVESHLSKTIAHQIRAMREGADWTQQQLADAIGSNQNMVYRLESPDYGRPTLTTLKRIASAFDVALVVRFVPFSELVDWVSGTPRVERGLRTASLIVPSYVNDAGLRDDPARGNGIGAGLTTIQDAATNIATLDLVLVTQPDDDHTAGIVQEEDTRSRPFDDFQPAMIKASLHGMQQKSQDGTYGH